LCLRESRPPGIEAVRSGRIPSEDEFFCAPFLIFLARSSRDGFRIGQEGLFSFGIFFLELLRPPFFSRPTQFACPLLSTPFLPPFQAVGEIEVGPSPSSKFSPFLFELPPFFSFPPGPWCPRPFSSPDRQRVLERDFPPEESFLGYFFFPPSLRLFLLPTPEGRGRIEFAFPRALKLCLLLLLVRQDFPCRPHHFLPLLRKFGFSCRVRLLSLPSRLILILCLETA